MQCILCYSFDEPLISTPCKPLPHTICVPCFLSHIKNSYICPFKDCQQVLMTKNAILKRSKNYYLEYDQFDNEEVHLWCP